MEPRETRRAEPPPPGGIDDYDLGPPPPPRPRPGADLSALFALLDAVRRAVPAELEGQFTALVREALLTLRSLIDWYLERLERGPREPELEEIPID